jgi:hypothetical protein
MMATTFMGLVTKVVSPHERASHAGPEESVVLLGKCAKRKVNNSDQSVGFFSMFPCHRFMRFRKRIWLMQTLRNQAGVANSQGIQLLAKAQESLVHNQSDGFAVVFRRRFCDQLELLGLWHSLCFVDLPEQC